jgi:hypothetical protein
MNTRRQFLIHAPLGFLVTAAACNNETPAPAAQSAPATGTPGAPPTFGTGAGSGPAITPATFAEAEKLMQVTMTAAERQQAADSWRQSLAQYLERRTGPRKVALADTDAPATIWNPMLPGIAPPPSRDRFVRSKPQARPCPHRTTRSHSRRSPSCRDGSNHGNCHPSGSRKFIWDASSGSTGRFAR